MIIETTSGRISSENSKVFLGIPFGKAERFKKPEKVCWEGTLSCNKIGSKPPQEEMLNKSNYSENCLTLNIFTPNVSGEYPVIVEFYGGAFQMGSNESSGMVWLNNEKVVHVIFNYRLGYLGWPLKKKVGIESYNLGLYDQYLALQWIKENIQVFGGDKNNITLYGFSAGAKSIAALLCSELSVKPLFNKIALSSGSYQCIRSQETANHLDELFCQENLDGYDLVTGDLRELIKRQVEFVHHHEATNFFGPVCDDIVITQDWMARLKSNLPEKAMISSSFNECGDYIFKESEVLENRILVDLFGENKKYFPQSLVERLDYPEEKGQLVQLISDANYRIHAHRLGNLYRMLNVEVYEYDFSVYPAKHSSDIGFLDYQQDTTHISLQSNLRKAFLQFFRNEEVNFAFAFESPDIKNYFEISLEEVPKWHDFRLMAAYPLTIFDDKFKNTN